MKISKIPLVFLVALVGLTQAKGTPALAESKKGPGPATGIVSGWVPNNGEICEGSNINCPLIPQWGNENYLGDLWTFECPKGGQVWISVDTKDDLDTGVSCLDPVVHVFDSQGNLLATGDDEISCSYPPVCGARCPFFSAECGSEKQHSLVVRDYGADGCSKGGGYRLLLHVFDGPCSNPLGCAGYRLPPKEVNLGGGPGRGLPDWVIQAGFPAIGPALDDEDVPAEPVMK